MTEMEMSDMKKETTPLLKEMDPKVVNMHEAIPLRQEVRELSNMAVQLSLRQMVRQVMTITDSAFQGHIGTKQLAGVSLAGMWMGVPSAFIQFSIQAINTLCSQAYGAGNHKLVGVWLQVAIVFALVGSIPVILWYMCVGHMIGLTMDDAETVEYGRQFAMVMAIGLIPQYIYGACSTYFAAQGIIMPATICSVFTMILNIGFNRLFIYGAFGWKGFGFIGSPLATVASTVCQLVFFLSYTVWYKQYHKQSWHGWSNACLQPQRVKTFLKLALPMGASAVVDWGSATAASAFSGLLGPNIAASESVLAGLFGVANSAVAGYSTSTQIRMSRYLGKGDAFSAKRVLHLGGAIVMAGATIMLFLIVLLKDHIFGIWTTDPVIIEMCNNTLVIFVICILVAFSRFMMTAVLNALSMADINLIANNIASWLVYLPLSYVLPIMCHMGLAGFWLSDTLGEATKVAILSYGLYQVNWQQAAEYAQGTAESEQTVNDEQEEKNALLAYKNEAMVGRTPESYRIPAAVTPSSAHHTPRARLLRRQQSTPKIDSRRERNQSLNV